MRTYALENRGRAPLYEYLYRCIRGDILDGTLTAGERLPSKRALAEHLHISVMTVEGAYRQLEAEGYVYTQPKRGFFVAEVERPRPAVPAPPAPEAPPEAPVYVAWANRNRSALVRVPMYKPGKEAATRMELRCPDPAANPYLAFAVMLAAGLRGMEQGYQLPDPVEADIFHMTPQELAENGIDSLPGSLFEAAEEMKKSELVREVLGEHIFTKLYENKIMEWDRYRTQVTQYEIERYLAVL